MSTFNRIIILCLILTTWHGHLHARHPPGLFSSRYELPDEYYNSDTIYNEKKYQEPQKNYLKNWPWLRDLQENEFMKQHRSTKLNPEVFEDTSAPELNDSIEYLTERLPMPMPMVRNLIKDQNSKKNTNHYMSLCHFKICNMGRKRNTRHLHNDNYLNNIHEFGSP